MQEQAEVANALFEKGRFDEALKEYRKMAEVGSVEAQLRVGWMYYTGHGVEVDLNEARRWYLKAAESNSPEGQFYLGRFYRAQTLYQQAMNCFQKSASHNYMPSIYQSGVMYELGEGVAIDKDKAYKYYEQAARMGHLRSQREMARMIIKGHIGFEHIPRGIFMLARVLYNAIRLSWKDPESDRIRW